MACRGFDLLHGIPDGDLVQMVSGLAKEDYYPDRAIVNSPSHVKKVDRALDDTPQDILQAYLVWQTAVVLSDRVSGLKSLKQFMDKLAGVESGGIEERWKTCLTSSTSALS